MTAVADAPAVIEAESAPAHSIIADVGKPPEDVAAISASGGNEGKAMRQGVSLLSHEHIATHVLVSGILFC